ncbi:MAG TPA: hypothetical protein VK578_09455 [Edaphobacter sp.]|nr:hypothetical protein [Edaphobacter sp.]
MQGPKRATTVLLAFILLTTGFTDYWEYSKAYHKDPSIYQDLLTGTAIAPNQYRIGVVITADFVARHAHLGLRHMFTLIDMIAGFVAVFTLFWLLRRSAAYRNASQLGRWFAAVAFLVLVQFYLAWVTWYQRPETLTTAALVTLTLLLLTVRVRLPGVAGYVATAGGMLLIAVAQGFVRADVAFGLHAGIFLFCLTRASAGLSMPRGVQAVTSLAAVFAAAGIQYYMMHIRYPHASYGDTPVFQLVLNFKESARLIAFTLFILPYAWTVYTVLRRRVEAEAPALALLCGSVVFMAMWWMAGRVEEVRIFLPFALAVAPLTVQCAVERWVLEGRPQEA